MLTVARSLRLGFLGIEVYCVALRGKWRCRPGFVGCLRVCLGVALRRLSCDQQVECWGLEGKRRHWDPATLQTHSVLPEPNVVCLCVCVCVCVSRRVASVMMQGLSTSVHTHTHTHTHTLRLCTSREVGATPADLCCIAKVERICPLLFQHAPIARLVPQCPFAHLPLAVRCK